jgi:hypothetical protein
MLHGMTNKAVAKLVPLAKSWLQPAELKLGGGAYKSEGYDPTQLAYVLVCKNPGKRSELQFELAASKESPVINPAFVIKGWGDAGASIRINGGETTRGKDFRIGQRITADGTALIVWIRVESTKPITVGLSPVTD